MHPEAFNFVAQLACDDKLSIIEIGSRQVNRDNTGKIRTLFPNANWTGLDLYAGPGVDIVVDAEQWSPPKQVELVICCEVLEHAPNWKALIRQAYTWLKPGGWFIMTCAGPGRKPHSHIDGLAVRPDEYYANLSRGEIQDELTTCGFQWVNALETGEDTQATAWKPVLD